MKDQDKIRRFRQTMEAHPDMKSGAVFEYFQNAKCTRKLRYFPAPEKGKKKVFDVYARNVSKMVVYRLMFESDNAECFITPSKTWVEPGEIIRLTYVLTEKFAMGEKPPSSFTTFSDESPEQFEKRRRWNRGDRI